MRYRLRAFHLLLICILILLLAHRPARGQADSDWLVSVNRYRAQALQRPVTEDKTRSAHAWLHARYIVKQDDGGHTEDPASPWYTPDGAAAGERSNVMFTAGFEDSDTSAIDGWMQAPFHALGVLNPVLGSVGYGSYRERDGGLQMAAALEISDNRDDLFAGVTYPIMWPAHDQSTQLIHHWGEWPNPLTACPGYHVPTGLPVLIRLGWDLGNYQQHQVMSGGRALDSCAFHARTYTNPNPEQAALAKNILSIGNTVVIIPREPLLRGHAYTVTVTTTTREISWSFRTEGATLFLPYTARLTDR